MRLGPLPGRRKADSFGRLIPGILAPCYQPVLFHALDHVRDRGAFDVEAFGDLDLGQLTVPGNCFQDAPSVRDESKQCSGLCEPYPLEAFPCASRGETEAF